MEEQKQETIFADGIFFNKPHENAPDFVKGSVGIRVKEAVEFLVRNENENGFVNIDLLKSKEKGTLYFVLNDWKPEKKVEGKSDEPF